MLNVFGAVDRCQCETQINQEWLGFMKAFLMVLESKPANPFVPRPFFLSS